MAKCLNILETVFGVWVLLSVPLLGCAGAALAELDIAVRVQRAAGPEALNVHLTVFYRPAALQ